MKVKRQMQLLTVIFIITFAFNLIYSLQSSEFTTGGAYGNLRIINSIGEQGHSMYHDKLSYGGRNYIFPPLFYYILSFFSMIFPLYFVAKIIPILFSSSIVFIVYFIAKKISNNRTISLLSAFMSGFIPVLTSLTLNTISVFSLSIPLFFLAFYFFLRIEENKDFVIYFVITYLLSLLTHPITLLLLVTLLIYYLVATIEKQHPNKIENEVILFTTFFTIWAYFLMYKEVLLIYGPQIIWKSIPAVMRNEYFSNFNILKGIINIGLIPFVFGIYTVYSYFFKSNKKSNYLYVSLFLTILISLWLRFIPLKVGLSFLAITLILLFSHYYKYLLIFLKKTKFAKYQIWILITIITLFIITSAIPCFMRANENIQNSFEEEIPALNWLKNNVNNTTILGSVHEGSLISFKTGQKNVADTNFLLIKNANQRLKDIKTIYTSSFGTEALPLLDKYNVTYIILSDRIKQYYNITSIKYTNNNPCFEPVYNKRITIFKKKCTFKVNPVGL